MSQQPIELYYWPTPNGWKISIMLEEIGLPYEVHEVNITQGDQFDDWFLEISPNNKMPAIVDPDGPGGKPLALFESGAILLYLADKTGQLIPQDRAAYYGTVQWLMFQMGSLGPMAGQAHHFRNYAPEKLRYAIDRYTNEVHRIYNVMDRRLGETTHVAGNEYSIADIACWPWVKSYENQGQDIDEFPNLKRWFDELGARPAVQKGVELLAERRSSGRTGGAFDEKAQEILFGKAQYQRR